MDSFRLNPPQQETKTCGLVCKMISYQVLPVEHSSKECIEKAGNLITRPCYRHRWNTNKFWNLRNVHTKHKRSIKLLNNGIPHILSSPQRCALQNLASSDCGAWMGFNLPQQEQLLQPRLSLPNNQRILGYPCCNMEDANLPEPRLRIPQHPFPGMLAIRCLVV